MIIGITGVFSSGKTTVSSIFSKHGYKAIDADKVGHKLLDKKQIKDKIIKEFGSSILSGRKISRRKLKDIVFYDHDKLIRLNRIIHPQIIKEIMSLIRKDKGKNVIVDGALLIEAGCLSLFDKLIVVRISRKEQLKRALKKGKYTGKEINSIIRSQLSQKEKLKYADHIIGNSGSLDDTKKAVKEVLSKL
ncbi:dephospho-CoA kinase [Candidatus Woesearchaeota archaeon]|nr:dephospho-CoA kinase [Candidatus Woesearchaeota archaeon]